MAKLTPQEFREKHARRLKGAIEDIRRGVERVDVAPGIKAAQAQEKMLAKLTEAVTSGKWADRVSAVPLEEWKNAILTKGINRIAQGVDGAASKVEAFAEELLAYQDRLLKEIEGMPDVTLEDGIARMTHWVRRMAEFKRGG